MSAVKKKTMDGGPIGKSETACFTNGTVLPADYGALLAAVKERVHTAQYAALKLVNKELVGMYWDIGRMIVERQTDSAHGAAIAVRLAEDLRAAFPGIAGFSRRNVFYMREFFLLYCGLPKVQPMVALIGWTHNLIILQRCKDPLEREFYIRMTSKFGWTKNVLIHQIDNQSYEKTLLWQTNFDKALSRCNVRVFKWLRNYQFIINFYQTDR